MGIRFRPGAIADIPDYMTLNNGLVPYHNAVHDNSGGQMPNPDTSPGDPIFWPFHAFLLAVYEHWRSHWPEVGQRQQAQRTETATLRVQFLGPLPAGKAEASVWKGVRVG